MDCCGDDLSEAVIKVRETGGFSKAAGYQERAGYCHYRGAFQTKTRDEFVQNLHQAMGTY